MDRMALERSIPELEGVRYIGVPWSCANISRGSYTVVQQIAYWKLVLCCVNFPVSIQWGAFEILSIIAGLISTDTLATHSILALTANISFNVPLGISIAASVRVGQALGDGRIIDSKRTTFVSILMGLVYSVANVAFVFSVKSFWGSIFSSDDTVKSMVAQFLPLMALFNFVDAQQCVLAGIMRGMGKQNLGALFNFIAYWIVGLPLAYTLAIVTEKKLPGIWYGETLGASVATASQIAYLLGIDWSKMSLIAIENSQE